MSTFQVDITEIIGMPLATASVYVVASDQLSVPHVCATSTLLTEPFPLAYKT